MSKAHHITRAQLALNSDIAPVKSHINKIRVESDGPTHELVITLFTESGSLLTFAVNTSRTVIRGLADVVDGRETLKIYDGLVLESRHDNLFMTLASSEAATTIALPLKDLAGDGGLLSFLLNTESLYSETETEKIVDYRVDAVGVSYVEDKSQPVDRNKGARITVMAFSDKYYLIDYLLRDVGLMSWAELASMFYTNRPDNELTGQACFTHDFPLGRVSFLPAKKDISTAAREVFDPINGPILPCSEMLVADQSGRESKLLLTTAPPHFTRRPDYWAEHHDARHYVKKIKAETVLAPAAGIKISLCTQSAVFASLFIENPHSYEHRTWEKIFASGDKIHRLGRMTVEAKRGRRIISSYTESQGATLVLPLRDLDSVLIPAIAKLKQNGAWDAEPNIEQVYAPAAFEKAVNYRFVITTDRTIDNPRLGPHRLLKIKTEDRVSAVEYVENLYFVSPPSDPGNISAKLMCGRFELYAKGAESPKTLGCKACDSLNDRKFDSPAMMVADFTINNISAEPLVHDSDGLVFYGVKLILSAETDPVITLFINNVHESSYEAWTDILNGRGDRTDDARCVELKMRAKRFMAGQEPAGDAICVRVAAEALASVMMPIINKMKELGAWNKYRLSPADLRNIYTQSRVSGQISYRVKIIALSRSVGSKDGSKDKSKDESKDKSKEGCELIKLELGSEVEGRSIVEYIFDRAAETSRGEWAEILRVGESGGLCQIFAQTNKDTIEISVPAKYTGPIAERLLMSMERDGVWAVADGNK